MFYDPKCSKEGTSEFTPNRPTWGTGFSKIGGLCSPSEFSNWYSRRSLVKMIGSAEDNKPQNVTELQELDQIYSTAA